MSSHLLPSTLLTQLFALNIIAMAVAIPAGLYGQYEDPGRWFREGRLMTWISFFQIVFVGILAEKIYKLRRAGEKFDWKEQASVWRLASVGFYWLAFDEILRVHEAIDRYAHKILQLEITEMSDRADDLIVALYGIIGLCVFYYYRREVLHYVKSFGWFFCGFALFFIMVAMDLVFNGDTVARQYVSDPVQLKVLMDWLNVIEDIFKNFGEIFFIAAFAACLQIAHSLGGKDEKRKLDDAELGQSRDKAANT